MHHTTPDADQTADDPFTTTERVEAQPTQAEHTQAEHTQAERNQAERTAPRSDAVPPSDTRAHTQGLPPTPTQPLPHASSELLPPPAGQPHPVSQPVPHPQPQAWPTPAPALAPAPMQATGHPAAYGGGPYGPIPQPMVTGKSSRPGLVIAVISLIVSGIALLTTAGMALMMFGGPGFPLAEGSAGGWAPITGQLPFSPEGAQVSAGDLRDAITERMEQDDWYVEDMTCPHVSKVNQGVVSVCHATMDDAEWAVIVYFEDAKGTYTLQPL